MSRRTRIALIAAAVLLSGCADVQAAPTIAYRAYDGPWRPVVVPEAAPAASEAPEPSYRPFAVLPAHPPRTSAPPQIRVVKRPVKVGVSQPSRTAHGIAGLATWYAYVPGGAAAGPALRAALGRHWRGRKVSVCVTGGNCVSVTLSDWCLCSSARVVDLDVRSFAQLARLSRGVIHVTVKW